MRHCGALLLLAACVVAFLPVSWGAAGALALAVAGALLVDPQVLRVFLRAGLVLALLFGTAVTAAVVAWSAGPERGLILGGAMLARLLVLVVLTSVLARAVDAEGVLAGARALGMERVGLVLGLALNTLPHLAVTARDVWYAHRVRSGKARWPLVRALPRLAEVLLAHTARLAEDAAAAAALRGHSALLTRRPAAVAESARLVVVTGSTGCGKTTAATAMAERLRSAGVVVAGFAQPGVFSDGNKIGFEVVDLATDESTELARRVGHEQGEHGTGYRFSAAGLQLAEQALARAAAGAVLVVDELGPMELRGRGHMAAVRRALAVPGLAAAVVVVRRNLVPALLATLEAREAEVVDVESEADIIDVLLRRLGEDVKALPPTERARSGGGAR